MDEKRIKKSKQYQRFTLLPTQIFSVGHKYPLFSLPPDVLAEVNSKFDERSFETGQSFRMNSFGVLCRCQDIMIDGEKAGETTRFRGA